MSNLNFEKEVLKAGKPVVVEFSAPWCGYCRRLAPVIDRLRQEQGDNLEIVEINIDYEPEITEQYEVNTIPTLILFQNGQASEQLVNPPSWTAIMEWLKSNGL